MGKIFVLMGKSSTGKDTIYRELISDKELGLKKIILYTTRPMREKETNGVQYFFITEHDYQDMEKKNMIIEQRTYNTQYGKWHYLTADDGQINVQDGNYLIIGTLESYCSLREKFGDSSCVPIMIEVEDRVRIARAVARENKQEKPKYDEMCRRYLADEQDFADEKIADAGISTSYDNSESKEACISKIKSAMLGYINI